MDKNETNQEQAEEWLENKRLELGCERLSLDVSQSGTPLYTAHKDGECVTYEPLEAVEEWACEVGRKALAERKLAEALKRAERAQKAFDEINESEGK